MTLGRGKYMNPRDGDVVDICVDVEDVVLPRSFALSGHDCDAARRSWELLGRLAGGKSPEDAARIAPREVIELLRLVPDEERCALTVIAAFRAALVDAHVTALATAEVRDR